MVIPELLGEDEWQEAKEMEGEGPGRAKDHHVQRARHETGAFQNDSSQAACGALRLDHHAAPRDHAEDSGV